MVKHLDGSLLQLSKMAPTMVKKREAKKVVNLCLRKDPRTSALGKTSSPKEMLHQMVLQYQAAGSKYLLALVSSPRPWTDKQLPSCLSLPTSTGQRRSKGCWSVLRRKLLARGTSQLRDRWSEQGSIQALL
ncbi:rCG55830 [Rattus norvegicus]|uniref:RCG55830 n=1 Tax=Rattus norvegicus TaxID=10116 RepID=A6JM10_RAT|nr:rCG55830 [Rattus norvegicus]